MKELGMSVEIVGSALLWALLATLLAQLFTTLIVWILGISPAKLVHEIVEIQNPAVGASFFVVSLVVSLFIGLITSSGFTHSSSIVEEILWIAIGIVTATLYSVLMLVIVHQVFAKRKKESLFAFLRREIIAEQNASMVFFVGGILLAPFLSMAFQII